MSVRVFAPAKINLTLKVARPRADGYHPLESIVAFADVGDIVEAEESGDLSLFISGEFAEGLSTGIDNLVLRGVIALAEAAGIAPRARLVLEKRLPIASGIGGGSSDAASALTALNQLWNLNWPPPRLAEIGRAIGADVPVFFSGAGAAHMSGVGEICAPMRMPPLAAVLVNPLQPVPTPAVYRQFDAMGLGSHLSDDAPPSWTSYEEAIAAMRALGNDLEPAAAVVAPAIRDLLADLKARPEVRHAALSGSGATCFALTHTGDDARAVAKDLAGRNHNWWVRATTLGSA
jgi:4-diphosphocytidyl-2-C-methyl-D-erythritol kinase